MLSNMSMSFNASIEVTELLCKTLENVAKSLASRCINEAANRHGFNAEEEIRILGLENLSLIRKQMAKKTGSKKDTTKVPKEKKEKKSVFPMPFVAELVDIAGCQGLAYNRGLFTQCQKSRMENGNFCKGCQSEADKNASGCPDCGTVEARLSSGLYEFKDPKGRSPVSYLKVLEKLKLSQESALAEAAKLNVEIPEEHLVIAVKEQSKKSKGRPKKSVAIEADNVTDLFAKLTVEGAQEIEAIADEEKPVKVSKRAKLSEEEKAAKKSALEAERALKKAERDAKLALEKQEREAKRKEEAEQKKKEREAKLAQEKAEREAKRAQEKAEKEQKKAQEKAAKEANKKSEKKAEKKAEPALATPPPVVAQQAKVSVSRIQIGGKAYLKSSTNIIYDPATKEELGIWNPVTKTIDEFPEDEEEEVEDGEEEEEGYETN